MKSLLNRAVFRAGVLFLCAVVMLLVWNRWPTDGTAGTTVNYNHFQMRK